MNKDEINLLWDVAFTCKAWAEDMIHLQDNGHPHGFKAGYVESKLKEADKALVILNKELSNGN